MHRCNFTVIWQKLQVENKQPLSQLSSRSIEDSYKKGCSKFEYACFKLKLVVAMRIKHIINKGLFGLAYFLGYAYK